MKTRKIFHSIDTPASFSSYLTSPSPEDSYHEHRQLSIPVDEARLASIATITSKKKQLRKRKAAIPSEIENEPKFTLQVELHEGQAKRIVKKLVLPQLESPELKLNPLPTMYQCMNDIQLTNINELIQDIKTIACKESSLFPSQDQTDPVRIQFIPLTSHKAL